MNYFLDTDICIFALKGQYPAIKKWIQLFHPEQIKIPAIVQSELLLGAMKSDNSKQMIHLVEKFLEPYEIVAFDEQAAISYARIRFELEKSGRSIGPNDLIIAATINAHQGTLVTHNIKEFKRISGLFIQEWTRETE